LLSIYDRARRTAKRSIAASQDLRISVALDRPVARPHTTAVKDGRTLDCVVPAAGRSQRMGTWKPLLTFGSATIIQTVVARAASACRRVIVVAGYRGDELARLLRGTSGVEVVQNPEWELGVFSSIRRGAAEVGSERFYITLGDMPWIRPEVYAVLEEPPSADAVFPVFGGRRGHPVLVSQSVRQAVLETDPTVPTMRQVLARFAAREVEWTDDSILRDIDTPEDYG